jgi:PAS domain S-box-containing protein
MNFDFVKDRRLMTTIYLISGISFIIILAGYWVLQSQEDAFRNAELENLKLIGHRNSVMLGNWINERETDAVLLSNNPEFVRTLDSYIQNKNTDISNAYILDRMNAFYQLKGYSNAFATDLSGKVLISLFSRDSYKNVELNNDWNKALQSRKPVMGDVKESELSPEEIVIDFVAPVYRNTKEMSEPIGFIVFRSSLKDYVYPMLAELPLKSKTVASNLVEKQGDRVVYLNRLKYLPGAPFRYSLPLNTPNLPAAMAVNGKEVLIKGIDYSGRKVIAALDSVSNTKWHLVTMINYREALKAFYFRRILVLLIILILIALVSAILISRNKRQEYDALMLKNANEVKRLAVLKHFEYLFKYANDIILLTDFDGKILEANGKADNMYGYTYDELKQMDIFQITAPEFRDKSKEVITSPDISSGVVYESEHINRNGVHFPVEISTISVTIDDKQYIQKIIRDISERKLAEKQLIELNKELADKVIERTDEVKIAQSKIDGFFKVSIELLSVTRNDGSFLQLNPAWESVLGYLIDELLNRKFIEFVHPDDLQETKEALNAMTEQNPLIDFINRYRCKDGTYKYLKWNSVPYGNLIYTAAHDITDTKNAEDVIQNLNDGLMNTNRELESFSYSVSHDLRAPLRSLEGYSSALRDGYADKIDEQGIHYLDRISNAAVKMATLINDLLQLSQLGQKQLTYQVINLSDIANKVAAELKEEYPTQQISFRIAETKSIKADSDLMRIVFNNLLGNARKFSSKKDISEVIFDTRKIDGQTTYYVQDNGEGFDMEYADKLFTPFQRYHHADDFPGTGIGLSIVLRIINKHKGKIWVESAVDKGTTVYFTINT